MSNNFTISGLGLEFMPFGQAPTSRVMTPLWGEGGLKARAHDPTPLGSPINVLSIY